MLDGRQWCRRGTAVAALAGVSLLPACTTARINQFRQFADAGIAYVAAVDEFTGEAANAAIDADSAALARARPSVPEDDRGRTVLDHDTLLKQRVEILGDLREHARLLAGYLVTLGALAESDAPQQVGDAARDLAASMRTIGTQLRDARIGDATIDSFTGSVVTISVARFRRAALERELRARAPLLERELDLQHAAMLAIAAQMRTDLTAALGHQELIDIVDPYRGGGKLPRTWAKRRREILSASAAVASADAAVSAAAQLKVSYIALVEDRLTVSDILALMGDINEILTLLEAIRGYDGNA